MAKKSLIEKAQEQFPDFTTDADAMTVTALNERLLIYAKELEESKEFERKENEDGELGKAKELVKELSAPFRDVKKALGLKMGYIANLIKEKGGK